MQTNKVVFSRDITSEGRAYSLTTYGQPPLKARSRANVSLNDVKFQNVYDDTNTMSFGSFGCGLVGVGTVSKTRLTAAQFARSRKNRVTRLSYIGGAFGDDQGNTVNEAKHVFSTREGLFAVVPRNN